MTITLTLPPLDVPRPVVVEAAPCALDDARLLICERPAEWDRLVRELGDPIRPGTDYGWDSAVELAAIHRFRIEAG